MKPTKAQRALWSTESMTYRDSDISPTQMLGEYNPQYLPPQLGSCDLIYNPLNPHGLTDKPAVSLFNGKSLALMGIGVINGIATAAFYNVYWPLVDWYLKVHSYAGLALLLGSLASLAQLFSVGFGITMDRYPFRPNQWTPYITIGFLISSFALIIQSMALVLFGSSPSISKYQALSIGGCALIAYIGLFLGYMGSILVIVKYSQREAVIQRGLLAGYYVTFQYIGVSAVYFVQGYFLSSADEFIDEFYKLSKSYLTANASEKQNALLGSAFVLGVIFLIPSIVLVRWIREKSHENSLPTLMFSPDSDSSEAIPELAQSTARARTAKPMEAFEQFILALQNTTILRILAFLLLIALGLGPRFIDNNADNALAIWSGLTLSDLEKLRPLQTIISLLMALVWTLRFVNTSWKKLILFWILTRIVSHNLLTFISLEHSTRSDVAYSFLVILRTSCRSWQDILTIALPVEIAQQGIEASIVGLLFSTIHLGQITSNSLMKVVPMVVSYNVNVSLKEVYSDSTASHIAVKFWAVVFACISITAGVIVVLLLPSQKQQAQFEVVVCGTRSVFFRNLMAVIYVTLLIGNGYVIYTL